MIHHLQRVAAIQLRPELGNVDANLERSRTLVLRGFSQGAQWVVLPELFTTGLAFDDCMLAGHRPLHGEPMQLLKELASEGGGTVAGSFLAESDGHVYNTFVLACSDGQIFTHDKDFPSGPIEHAYYAGGEDEEYVSLLHDYGVTIEGPFIPSRIESSKDGVFSLPGFDVGVALCWEMIRYRTIRRLQDRTDVVFASSAWPEIDQDVGFPGMNREQIVNLNTTLITMLQDAPVRLAKLLGVPVIHANLVGPQRATKLFDQEVEVLSRFAGESQIVDAHGKTLARRSAAEGEGLVMADVALEKVTPQPALGDQFWIPQLSPILKELWYQQGAVGRQYYLNSSCPYRNSTRRDDS